ncbi:MAG: hypothetical protein U0136_20205 [Bdellovibrionota bacterium]
MTLNTFASTYFRRTQRTGSRPDGMGVLQRAAERGIAFLELAIILAIFTPLIVGFVFVWLPDFSRRSNELMNALSSLGGCLVDPINLYRYAAGQAIVRDDYQDIVKQVVSTCGQMSEGQTVCGYVYEGDDNQIYTFGLNETLSLKCANLDVNTCVGKAQIPTGMVVAFLMSDGTSRCEYIPGTDPGIDPIRGDESSGGSGPSTLCPTGSGYYETKCIVLWANPDPNLNDNVDVSCCADGTVWNSAAERCEGCPVGTHICTVTHNSVLSRVCVSDVTYPGGLCLTEVPTNSGTYCTTTEVGCSGMAMYWCCPSGSSCPAYQSLNFSGCSMATPYMSIGCPEGSEGTVVGSSYPSCTLKFRSPVGGKCAQPAKGDVVVPLDRSAC